MIDGFYGQISIQFAACLLSDIHTYTFVAHILNCSLTASGWVVLQGTDRNCLSPKGMNYTLVPKGLRDYFVQ